MLIAGVSDRDKKLTLVETAVEKEQTVKALRESIRAIRKPKAKQKEQKKDFRNWTDQKNNVNICSGCENDCLYCHMKLKNAGLKKLNQPEDWHNWELRKKDVDATRKLRDGIFGFPSSHDIFPEIMDEYLKVLGKLLRAGNEVLIMSKPRLNCIKQICEASQFFKDKIVFRFTIGAMDDDILGFWEPNAPQYLERKVCLAYARNRGFETSVSMEPMLDTENIDALIDDLKPLVSKKIWLGTMEYLDWIGTRIDAHSRDQLEKVEQGQTPDKLLSIFNRYKDDPLIKWKDKAKNIIKAAGKKKFDWPKALITIDSGETKNVAVPVVISATRRSDIPACYADKFMEDLRLGHTRYNHYGSWNYVSLAKTRFIVFWTKNPRPLIQHLDEIDRMGIGYYFTYTLNNYEKEGLEPKLPPLQDRIDTFCELSERKMIGKEKVIWRFDPLILSDKISTQCLIDKIGFVMEKLAGHTDKLVFSYLDPDYENGKNKLKKAGIEARPFSDEEKVYVAWHIADMAAEYNIQAATCSEDLPLSDYGVVPNKCIDYHLMQREFSHDAKLMDFIELNGMGHHVQGDECGCNLSYDIGIVNTCENGCVYCYANASEKAVQNKLKRIETDATLLAESTPAEAVPAELN